MAEISVVVPVYKVEPFIHKCVGSILNQSFRDLELILVDDGSPDSCPRICDDYAKLDPRVRVIHQENGGLSAARNAGIEWMLGHSDSRWVAFVDSDDWIHRDYLQRMHSAAAASGAELALCDIRVVQEVCEDTDFDFRESKTVTPEEAYVHHYGMCMTACCKLIHRDLLSEFRFPVGRLHEDAFVTHLLLFGAKGISVCEEPLYYYRVNPDSITRVKWEPKRLDELEGHKVRFDYLSEHGYANAVRQEIKESIEATKLQAELLAKVCRLQPEFRVYDRQVAGILRRLLRQGRTYGLHPFDCENMWLYFLACPVRWVYPALQWVRSSLHGNRAE